MLHKMSLSSNVKSKKSSDFILESGVLYHGSGVVVENPEIRIQGFTKDFSYGFYCTRFEFQAKRWARRKAKHGHACLNVYDFNYTNDLSVKVFKEMDDEWLDFVAVCRDDNTYSICHDFDITEGPVADDEIWTYTSEYLSGTMSREEFWLQAKAKGLTNQVVFHTPRALQCLTFLHCEYV